MVREDATQRDNRLTLNIIGISDMTNKITGQAMGKILCDALGLDPNRVMSIKLTAEPGDMATVDVRMAVDTDQAAYICSMAQAWHLTSMGAPEREGDTVAINVQGTQGGELVTDAMINAIADSIGNDLRLVDVSTIDELPMTRFEVVRS